MRTPSLQAPTRGHIPHHGLIRCSLCDMYQKQSLQAYSQPITRRIDQVLF